MTAEEADAQVLGSLRSVDGKGVVRIESHFGTEINELWSALTDPGRLVQWLGEFQGDLHPGGKYRCRYFSSGAEVAGRVELCEPPRRFTVANKGLHAPNEQIIEATLTPAGDETILLIEQHGLRLDWLPAFGAGLQIHVEDLAAHLAGGPRCDSDARMSELIRLYETLPIDD
jgi:uncharacterized protein YndB with AHSA1/START domain